LALSHLRVEEGLPMFSIFDTSNKIAWSDVYTAVLPLGAVEPEGLHFCTVKSVFLLPIIPFSSAMGTRDCKGTIALQQQTIRDVLNDIASALCHLNFKRIIFLDFSNYNWITKHRVRELNLKRELIQAVWINPKQFVKEAPQLNFYRILLVLPSKLYWQRR
jgi:creatinine amidohydrolase/Fe(II)-dependent formamide hydrolase-like protein